MYYSCVFMRQHGNEDSVKTVSYPYRCKKPICICRNTALFLGKVCMKDIFLDVTDNGVQKQCKNIV